MAVAEPPVFRPLPALLALAAGVGLSTTLAWASSTEVGQTTTTPVGSGTMTPIVAVSTVAGTPSYETPDGVLTRWRFHSSADPMAGGIRLKIFRLIERVNASKAKYEFIAESSFKALDPDTAYEFQERIPVKQGYLLGLLPQAGADIVISVPGTPDNRVGMFPGGDLPVGGTGTSTTENPDQRVSVAATVESDADKDGFGDDTQDKCPSDPARQDPPCASTAGTAADKRAPSLALAASSSQDVVAKRAVFVNVTSDENGTATGSGTLSVPGASKTFKLKSDTKTVTAGKESELKLRVTRKALRAVKRSLRRGKRVRATATVAIRDAAGNIATAKRTVKVKRPKRR